MWVWSSSSVLMLANKTKYIILGTKSVFGNVQTAESTGTLNKINVNLPSPAIQMGT